MKTYTIDTWIGDDDVRVVVNYIPGDPGCHTMRNGDPGWPPTDPEIEVVAVRKPDGALVIEGDYSVDEWDALHQRLLEECIERDREDDEARSWLRDHSECDGRRQ